MEAVISKVIIKPVIQVMDLEGRVCGEGVAQEVIVYQHQLGDLALVLENVKKAANVVEVIDNLREQCHVKT